MGLKTKLLKIIRKRYLIEYKEGNFAYTYNGKIIHYYKKLIMTDLNTLNCDFETQAEFRIENDDFEIQLNNAKELMLLWIRDTYSSSVSRAKKHRRLVHNTIVWYNPNLLLKAIK